MNVKPVKHQNVLVRLAKISKAQKQAAKAAAAEAKAAAQAAQGTDEFVKTGMKSPKFKKWAIGIASALAAAGAITTGAIFSRPKTYDAPLEARQRAYAEYRGYTQSEADSFASDYMTRNSGHQEFYAILGQYHLDRRAFADILDDHGFDKISDKISDILPNPYLNRDKDKYNKKAIFNKKLKFLKENMTTKEYQKFVENMEKVNSDNHMPYYGNVLGQYTVDSIAFRKYLDKVGFADNNGVVRDFKNICKAIKPDNSDYEYCYFWDSYKPFKMLNKDDLLENARDKYTFYK